MELSALAPLLGIAVSVFMQVLKQIDVVASQNVKMIVVGLAVVFVVFRAVQAGGELDELQLVAEAVAFIGSAVALYEYVIAPFLRWRKVNPSTEGGSKLP